VKRKNKRVGEMKKEKGNYMWGMCICFFNVYIVTNINININTNINIKLILIILILILILITLPRNINSYINLPRL